MSDKNNNDEDAAAAAVSPPHMKKQKKQEDEDDDRRRQPPVSSVPILVDWKEFINASPTVDVSKDTSATATLLLDTQSLLGEGIIYDDVKNEIVWCDILGKKFHKLDMKTGTHTSYQLPHRMIGSFGLLSTSTSTTTTKDDNEDDKQKYDGAYLVAWEDGFQIVNLTTMEELTPMSVGVNNGEVVNPIGLPTRLNDGRCDPTGKHYICGGYFGELDNVTMKVFSCQWKDNNDDNDADATSKTTKTTTNSKTLIHEPILDNIKVTNSLCFSPDGNTMYFADSPTKEIVAYDYNLDNVDGQTTTTDLLSNKRLVHKVDLKDAVPDGSCVDSDGYIWNAIWWNGIQTSRVRRIDPNTGKVVFEVNMPDGTSRVSCCCFGGSNLDILFITTAAVGDDTDEKKEPHAGGIYAIKLAGVKGKLEYRFQV